MSAQCPTTIWLQPWCEGCEKHCYSGEGRMWCEDNVFDACEECGNEPVKYTIALDQPPVAVTQEKRGNET